MNKINETQAREMRNAIIGLRDAGEGIERVRDDILDSIGTLNEHIQRYNNMLENAKQVRDQVVGDIDNFTKDLPEGWEDTEAGKAITDWYERWDELDLAPIDRVDEPDIEEIEHATLLEDLPFSIE